MFGQVATGSRFDGNPRWPKVEPAAARVDPFRTVADLDGWRLTPSAFWPRQRAGGLFGRATLDAQCSGDAVHELQHIGLRST